MAVWQYRLNFLPIVEGFDYTIFHDNGMWSEYDPEALWKKVGLRYSELYLPNSLPEKGKSWSDDTTVFGDEQKYHLEICKSGDLVCSVCARLDLRDDVTVFLKVLIEFAQKNNFVILGQDIIKLPSDLNAILKHIQESNSLKIFSHFTGAEGNMLNQDKPNEIKKWPR